MTSFPHWPTEQTGTTVTLESYENYSSGASNLLATTAQITTSSRTSSTSSSASSSFSPNHNNNHNVTSVLLDSENEVQFPAEDDLDEEEEEHSDHGGQSAAHRPNGQAHNTKVQIYHQKSTTATGSTVPLSESQLCASSIVSTVNVTQNIKSEKKSDGVTEITINRVYETAVKNSTCIVNSSKVVGTRYEAVGTEAATSSQVQELFDDRLSEHEEYEEFAAADGDSTDGTHTSHSSRASIRPSIIQYEQFERVQDAELEKFATHQAFRSVSTPQVAHEVLHSEPLETQYQTTSMLQPEVLAERVTSSLVGSVAQSAVSEQVSQQSVLLTSSVSQSKSSSVQQSFASTTSSLASRASSRSASTSEELHSFVTSSVTAVSSVSSQSVASPLMTSHLASIPTSSAVSSRTVSLSQSDDRVQLDEISINFAEGRYSNRSTGVEHSLEESIQEGLLDFKIEPESGPEILLSQCVQPDGLIRLPQMAKATTFAELVQLGLVTAHNCTLIDRVTENVVSLKSTLPREAFTEPSTAEDASRQRAQSATASPAASLLRPSLLSTNEPNFPSVLTISSQEISRQTAKLSIAGPSTGAIAAEVRPICTCTSALCVPPCVACCVSVSCPVPSLRLSQSPLPVLEHCPPLTTLHWLCPMVALTLLTDRTNVYSV